MSRYRHGETTALHLALVTPLALRRIPPFIATFLLSAVALLPILVVGNNVQMAVGIVHWILLVADWFTLGGLSRTRRSFGPTEPPLYAITILRSSLTIIASLLIRRPYFVLPVDCVMQIALLGLSIYTQWVEPIALRVSHLALSSNKLTPGEPPIRVLQLADLHVEHIGLREEKLKILESQLAPDIIVFTGDFINQSYNREPSAVETVRSIISEWHAPYGVYCVSGSPLVETQELVAQFVDGLNIRWLRNEIVDIDVRGQKIRIIGITCTHQSQPDHAVLNEVLSGSSTKEFTVLLYHSPDLAPLISRQGIDLYLCGHTHGGQIRLPIYGALITGAETRKRFDMGRYQVGHTTLYTSRGIGLEGAGAPRARLLCPPEITLWTLTGDC